ncbi:hypothetical protein P3T76_004571 [Phytophthora citrophthora]|uniref:Uncharacterized protein n=1 Tax=Phytophthora citrophthora TaxID=4793 RepID=A0AAD9GU49_9STRA|nr:hypothetical protein P3T76_004571 [Phytophthora citrophthora]
MFIHVINSAGQAMEFQECFSLLATRPPHAHEHCEEEQHQTDKETQSVDAPVCTENTASKQPEDLKELSARALVQTFQRLQESRVQIYAEFRQGFQVHQKTEQFPAFCDGITKRFSAVSEQINQVEKLLREEKKQIPVAQLIRKIQLEEKEKLLLTSAVLIEKMRLNDAEKQHDRDASTVAFLERSVKTLTTKHTDCVVRINEILEDLYAETADLEDD